MMIVVFCSFVFHCYGGSYFVSRWVIHHLFALVLLNDSLTYCCNMYGLADLCSLYFLWVYLVPILNDIYILDLPIKSKSC